MNGWHFNIYPGKMRGKGSENFYFDFLFKTFKQEQIILMTGTSSDKIS